MSDPRVPSASWTVEAVARTIDHTALKPETPRSRIEALCAEAREHGFAAVCVNPTWVGLAAHLLHGSPVKACTVIGFPLGATLTAVKALEAREAILAGAQELDMVINIGRLKDREDEFVVDDIGAVVAVARTTAQELDRDPILVKVIIETALLTDEEKRRACRAAQQAGADFVKTSTGFAGGGATVEDVRLMRETVGPEMGVKAAGGIRTAADALAMLEAGADRIGASAGVHIVHDLRGRLPSPPSGDEG